MRTRAEGKCPTGAVLDSQGSVRRSPREAVASDREAEFQVRIGLTLPEASDVTICEPLS